MERDWDDLLIILSIQCSLGRSPVVVVVVATSQPEELLDAAEASGRLVNACLKM